MCKILADITEQNEIKVIINDNDYKVFEKYKNEFKQKAGMVKKFELEKNSGITEGGIILEMSSGVVDARIESQISKIKEALLDD